MATITSAQAGDLFVGATWVGGVAPSPGDNLICLHAVSCSDDFIVGASLVQSDATWALDVRSTGSFSIAAGKTVKHRGHVLINQCNFTLGAGASFLHDSSQAADPANTRYKFQLGSAHYGTNPAKIIGNGTSGARCTFGYVADNSAGKPYFTRNAFTDTMAFNCAYTDFNGYSDTSGYMLENINFTSFFSNRQLIFDHCRFDGCGKIWMQGGYDLSDISITYNTWKNTTSAECLRVYGKPSATRLRVLHHNVFDKEVSIADFAATVHHSVFMRKVLTAVAHGNFEDNFFSHVVTSDGMIGNLVTGCYLQRNYFFDRDHPAGSPHFIHFGTTSKTFYVFNNVFEYEGTDENGDSIIPVFGSAGDATTIHAQGNIVLPNGGGYSSGSLVSGGGGSGTTLYARNNTMFSATDTAQSLGAYNGEGGELTPECNGHDGWWAEFKNNLVYSSNGSGTMLRKIGSKVVDNVHSDVADYNCGYNMYSGTCYKGAVQGGTDGTAFTKPGYAGHYFSDVNADTVLGAHDVYVNPQFVDSARDYVSWDLYNGGPGTADHAMSEMAKMNDSDFNPAYTIENLIAYIRSGFTPTNTILATAGEGGSYIGAVEFSVTPTTSTRITRPIISAITRPITRNLLQ